MPRIVDQFQTYLRELRVRDLRGSGGIYRMQAELLWRVNQAAAPIEVKDVLFQGNFDPIMIQYEVWQVFASFWQDTTEDISVKASWLTKN